MSRVLVWKKSMSVIVAASTVFMAACRDDGVNLTGARVKAVIGASELSPEQDTNLAQVIGRLSFAEGSCTAFVTGASEITTAAHCVGAESSSDLGALWFQTGAGISAVVREVLTLDTVHDVAVLRVEANFTHQMSWSDLLSKKAKVVGYNAGRDELLTSAPCEVAPSNLAAAMLTHICDTEPGMSGAPLVDEDGLVLGVHIGHLGNVQQNVAADATRFTVKAGGVSLTDQDAPSTSVDKIDLDKVDQEWGPRIELPKVKVRVEWPKELRQAKVEPHHLACIYALNAGLSDSSLCGTCLTAAGVATAGAAAAACAIPCGMAVADLTAVIISCQ